jgi:hypothetical protein
LHANASVVYTGIQSAIHDGDKTTILALLSKCRALRCSDPRDQLYSLLSLVHADDDIPIVPDYSKLAKDILPDFATQAIKTRGIGFLHSR